MFRTITSLVPFPDSRDFCCAVCCAFSWCEPICHNFPNTGIHHEFFGLDNSRLLLHTCLLRHRQLSSLPACTRSTLPLSFHLSAVLSLSRRFLVSLAPILGFGSRVTSTFVCILSPIRHLPLRVTFARQLLVLHVRLLWLKGKQLPESHLRFCSPPALLAVVLSLSPVPPAPSWCSLQQRGLPSVSPAPLCSTLPRRSRWTGTIAR